MKFWTSSAAALKHHSACSAALDATVICLCYMSRGMPACVRACGYYHHSRGLCCCTVPKPKAALVMQLAFALLCCCTSHWCVAAPPPPPSPNLCCGAMQAAIAEAAFMTGMERNSLQVAMAAFAPLLSHWNDRACPHNMVIFDNHRYRHQSHQPACL